MDKVIEKPSPKYYLPLDMTPGKNDGISWNPCCVIVRADPNRAGQLTAMTRVLIRQEFPGSIPSITWLGDQLEPQYRPWRLGATLFTAFGVLALVVAVVGIYSTVSYGVTQRIHEFGVRIALGAQMRDVLRLVVGQGLRTVGIGIAFGIALTAMSGRFIASLLYGVTPGDPATIAAVVLTLLVVGAAAALIPAWRAARVDPATALRSD
jgi:ABC-type antimicrobial peptide transport system permease subunit